MRVAVVTDNAANIVLSVDVLKDAGQWPEVQLVRCAGHTLQLCVNSAIKQDPVARTVGAARRLVAHFKKGHKAKTGLKEKQEQQRVPQHELIQDVATRWNSTCYMLERLLEQRWPITALSSAPDGLSVTELEIRQFEALYPDAAQERMFCYFRDSNITNSVPVAWRADFAPESREAESKMSALKRRLRESEAKVTENYPSEWGGVVDGKPHLKNLESFRKDVLEDLWAAVKEQFIESADESTVSSEESEQEAHQENLCRQFFGRSKLVSAAVTLVEQAQSKGGLLVLEGGAGEGKTVFMAALGHALKTTKMKPAPREVLSYSAAASRSSRPEPKTTRDVISYSTGASQSARSVENLLRFLIKSLTKNKESEKETPLPQSYQELVSEFHCILSEHKKNSPLVVLVDGVDLLQDGSGHVISDWIPQHLPQGVCLVISVPTSSSLLQTLVKKKGTLLFTLTQLTATDRKEIVQKRLDTFGKKLSDSAFNNQVQTLIMKKGAASPLYLQLACEDLKNFASFDKLKDSLQTLPQSLPQLVLFSLDRLCSEHRGILGLRWALAALTVSSTGLKERDLYAVMNTCNDLSTLQGALSWDRALDLSRKPRGRIPMANFTRIFHSLQSCLKSFFPPTETDRSRAHLVLAAHLWTSADPMGADTFLHCEASSLMQLPLSLCHQLYQSLNYLGHRIPPASLFVALVWPALFVQQALNEPPQTSAHAWAQSMMGKGGVRAVKWLNNTESNLEMSALVSSFSSEPSCLVLSPDGHMMVVGTDEGLCTSSTHKLDKLWLVTIVRSQFGLLLLVFALLGSVSGEVRVWSVSSASCLGCFQAHTGSTEVLTFIDNGRRLLTAGADHMLQLWSGGLGRSVTTLKSEKCLSEPPQKRRRAPPTDPALCVSVTGDTAAVGTKKTSNSTVWTQALILWDLSSTRPSKSLHHCHRDWISGCAWTEGCVVSSSNDGRLCFWDLETGKRVKEICWNSSLTSVCCQGSYVASGCSDGGLHVWNWESAVEVCHISAHEEYINHCALITDAKESNSEDLIVATASEDGTVKVWRPLQVEHCSSFMGHTGAIRSVVPKMESSELLTVSEDGSVRCWDWDKESPPLRKDSVTALCFDQTNSLVLAGFDCGLVELWQNNRIIGHKQIQVALFMTCDLNISDLRLDLTCDLNISDLRLDLTCDLNITTNMISAEPISQRRYQIQQNSAPISDSSIGSCFRRSRRFDSHPKVIFNLMEFAFGGDCQFHSSFGNLILLSTEDEEDEKKSKEREIAPLITAATVDNVLPNFQRETSNLSPSIKMRHRERQTWDKTGSNFIVCGDVKGNMFFNLPPELSSWSSRKPAHTDRITALRLTKHNIISASHDKSIKIWDRETKKQLGMFVCTAPVVCLEVNPKTQLNSCVETNWETSTSSPGPNNVFEAEQRHYITGEECLIGGRRVQVMKVQQCPTRASTSEEVAKAFPRLEPNIIDPWLERLLRKTPNAHFL
ncbi:hypothetical protein WMY93_000722 [Mugilogobius chulae]|uniref:NACHT domain-containing protein n=1 Tax=Mugilogobius chulae TaxID=88201 RepID=A0AAW0Q032_9GOBI